tara:strand:- start:360 stop:1499 length:1140 start_codon:yes stop_codon:yes gene_type:complete
MGKNKSYFLSEYSDNTLEVSWESIEHNINYFRSRLNPSTKVMLMVKAAAYGHYTSVICKRIEANGMADMLGVASIAEGIELRVEDIQLPVMVQNVNPKHWDVMVEYCLEPVIYSEEILASFLTFLQSKKSLSEGLYPIHLKLNTGMNRLGFNANQLQKLVSQLKDQRAVRVGSIMSHLSSSGNLTAEDFTLDQIQQFEAMCITLKSSLKIDPICHILNTDGINYFLKYQMDMVRLGIGLYGASEASDLKQDLWPVARLTSKVIAVRRVGADEYISYNRSGSVSEESNIALLSLGYADGVPRKLGNGNWQVEINGKLYPTVGNICMDICMLDLGQDEVKVGDEAIVFGGKKTIFDFAEAQETITYEALTNIGNRMKRKLV